jgi:hypothetical protein
MGIFEAGEAEGAQSIIMALSIPHRCPQCFASVTLIQSRTGISSIAGVDFYFHINGSKNRDAKLRQAPLFAPYRMRL